MLQLHNITKLYKNQVVLKNINLSIAPSTTVAIVGPSGSGKSTLLQIAGLIDRASSGRVSLDGQDCSQLSSSGQTLVRRQKLGFVYQFHHLLADFNVVENLIIPQRLLGKSYKVALAEALKILSLVNLHTRAEAKIDQLSGGEQQRVAVARALINQPSLLIADEPTGNLDHTNASLVFDLFTSLIRERNAALLMVTHNLELAKRCDRIITLQQGSLIMSC